MTMSMKPHLNANPMHFRTVASSTAVTSTACGTFQFAGVNVTLFLSTVPSVVSELAMAIVTFAIGWLARTIVNVAVPPASVVGPLTAETIRPAVSSSVFVNATSFGFMPLYSVSVEVAAPITADMRYAVVAARLFQHCRCQLLGGEEVNVL